MFLENTVKHLILLLYSLIQHTNPHQHIFYSLVAKHL